jgi:hypothetical protein
MNLNNNGKMNEVTYDKLRNHTQVLNAITQNFPMANKLEEKTK